MNKKEMKFLFGILFNICLLIFSVLLFIDISILSNIFFVFLCFQPVIPFYNYYKSENVRQLVLFNGLLVFSNILPIILIKLYYEFIYKSIQHELSWGAVSTEIGYIVFFWLLLIITAIVLIECIVSLIKYMRKNSR